MTYEEAIAKLDEAVRNNTIHHSARDIYASWCGTPEGRESVARILDMGKQLDRKRQERRGRRDALIAASRGKGEAS